VKLEISFEQIKKDNLEKYATFCGGKGLDCAACFKEFSKYICWINT
jgi:hypothetical protein